MDPPAYYGLVVSPLFYCLTVGRSSAAQQLQLHAWPKLFSSQRDPPLAGRTGVRISTCMHHHKSPLEIDLLYCTYILESSMLLVWFHKPFVTVCDGPCACLRICYWEDLDWASAAVCQKDREKWWQLGPIRYCDHPDSNLSELAAKIKSKLLRLRICLHMVTSNHLWPNHSSFISNCNTKHCSLTPINTPIARLQIEDAMELHHDQYAESVIMKQCECKIIYNMPCKKAIKFYAE